jgi:hypothetical protein
MTEDVGQGYHLANQMKGYEKCAPGWGVAAEVFHYIRLI